MLSIPMVHAKGTANKAPLLGLAFGGVMMTLGTSGENVQSTKATMLNYHKEHGGTVPW